MESVIIASPSPIDSELKKGLSKIGSIAVSTEGRIVLENGDSRLYVSRDSLIQNEMEPERLERITFIINEPIFYTIEFSDIRLCKNVLEIVVNNSKIVVDNDHGVILPGDKFVALIQSRQDWDWRVEPA